MKMTICVYRDTKLNIYGQPFYIQYHENEEIIESTRRMCANPQLPEVYFDYDLYRIGEYDDKTCEIKTQKAEFLVSLADFKYLAPVKEKVEKADVVG